MYKQSAVGLSTEVVAARARYGKRTQIAALLADETVVKQIKPIHLDMIVSVISAPRIPEG